MQTQQMQETIPRVGTFQFCRIAYGGSWHVVDFSRSHKAVCGHTAPFGGWNQFAHHITRSHICKACRRYYDAFRARIPEIGYQNYYGSKLPIETRLAIYERDDWRCQWCLITLTTELASLDHVIPHSVGGPDVPGNLITACRPCNNNRNSTPLALSDPETIARIKYQLLLPLSVEGKEAL